MRLIEEFSEKVLNTKDSLDSFMVEEGERYNFFLQCNVGKARYVYSEYAYKNANFHASINLKPELVAIVSDGKLYIVDEFKLDIHRTIDEDLTLPENTFRIGDVVKRENTYVKYVIFPDFYNALQSQSITDEQLLKRCTYEARHVLFAKQPVLNEMEIAPLFNEQDIADSLCGIIKLEDEAVRRLTEKKEDWIFKKSYNQKIIELMEDHSVVEDYEMEIAEGLRSVDARTVTVEFELNGKNESGKMDPDIIIRNMITNNYFTAYEFSITKRGNELMEKLNAETGHGSENVLTCKNITKITYGKKLLYEKK